MAEQKELMFKSPAGGNGKSLKVIWRDNLTANEIIAALKFCENLFPKEEGRRNSRVTNAENSRVSSAENSDLGITILIKEIEESADKSFEFMQAKSIEYNKFIKNFSKTWTGMLQNNKKTAVGLENPVYAEGHEHFDAIAEKVLELAFRRLNKKPTDLNRHYKNWTDEVYGATTYHRLAKIILDLDLTKKDVFVDLGSGVGNVIVHVASASNVKKVIGIEMAELPASIALEAKDIFKSWMHWLGKKTCEFDLIKGDFFNHTDLIITEATVIFMNNLAFTPETDRGIIDKIILAGGSVLRHGTRIICTKKIYPSKNDEVIIDGQTKKLLDVLILDEFSPLDNDEQCVTWTDKEVTYYKYTVSHQKSENSRPATPARACSAMSMRTISINSTPSSTASKSSKNKRSRISFQPVNKVIDENEKPEEKRQKCEKPELELNESSPLTLSFEKEI